MSYVKQLEYKRQAVQDNLQRVAKIPLKAEPAAGMETPWHYRNKTTWQTAVVDGKIKAGFFGIRSHQLVPVLHCSIAYDHSNKAKEAVIAWMAEFDIPPYQELSKSGMIRQIITRANDAGELMVILSFNGEKIPRQVELIQHLNAVLPKLVSICATNQFLTDESEDDVAYSVIFGDRALKETIDGVRFSLSPFSFFQVNHAICREMYRYVLQQAISDRNSSVIDVYSGVGSISLLAAKSCRQVIWLELSSGAIKDARMNALDNQIMNVQFIQGYAENELPRLIQSGFRADAIILDPPRKGAHPDVLKAITEAQPERIVYISCHPGSQARDAAILEKSRYKAISAKPFDMFCQTAEIENVITFSRS
jgi:23S rRNA (uracil1939-C5)-methyltransferase